MIDRKIYFIQNKEGKYLRRIGYGGYGESWVDDFKEARIYPKLKTARAQVTFWSHKYPEYGVPDILMVNIENYVVLDETERVNKIIKKMKRDEIRHDYNSAKYQLKAAQSNLKRAEEELKFKELKLIEKEKRAGTIK